MKNRKRIVQLIDSQSKYHTAVVVEPYLHLVLHFNTIYDLAIFSIENKFTLSDVIDQYIDGTQKLKYNDVYFGNSDYKLTTPIHHPIDQRFCMVTGTGLTHKASAENRQKMHDSLENNTANDSIKMYQIGVENGQPTNGGIGAQPEWFYKGNGSVLKAHNDKLLIPNYGNDGGEEPELAAVYINDKNGKPFRIGFTTGNEFSDHVMEKKNYLYLAPSKIRNCSIGPELVLTDEIDDIKGNVAISRLGNIIWEKEVATGEKNMCHSLENLEYHHFKYENHRFTGDLHIHFLGTQAFSFGAGIALEKGDKMTITWENMGRPLVNYLDIDKTDEVPLKISQI